MKKTLFFLCAIALLSSCSKDDEGDKYEDIKGYGIYEFGMSVENIKSLCTDADKEEETSYELIEANEGLFTFYDHKLINITTFLGTQNNFDTKVLEFDTKYEKLTANKTLFADIDRLLVKERERDGGVDTYSYENTHCYTSKTGVIVMTEFHLNELGYEAEVDYCLIVYKKDKTNILRTYLENDCKEE